jgi:predicted outer membrane protein
MRHAALALAALAAAACAPSYEGTVTFRVDLGKDAVTGTTVAGTRSVESDDEQWKPFLTSAKTALGASAKGFDVTGARLALDLSRAKAVGKYEDVLKGTTTLYFQDRTTGGVIDLATGKDLKGTAPIALSTTGNGLSELAGILAASDFKVGVRADSAVAADTDFKLPLVVTLDVTAQ